MTDLDSIAQQRDSLYMGICDLDVSWEGLFAQGVDTQQYELQSWLNPCHFSLQVNERGATVESFTIQRKIDQKKGLAILKMDGTWQLIGAGTDYETGGNDFKWINTWEKIPRDTLSFSTYTKEGDISGTVITLPDGESLKLIVEKGPVVYLSWIAGEMKWLVLES